MTPFTTSPSAPVFGKTKFADINACMAYLKSQPKLVTRIGRAALGRILTMLLYLLHLRPLLIETVDDTIEAVFGYLADPDYVNPGFCDNDIFGILKIEIDKCVARSAKAREAAARRKAILFCFGAFGLHRPPQPPLPTRPRHPLLSRPRHPSPTLCLNQPPFPKSPRHLPPFPRKPPRRSWRKHPSPNRPKNAPTPTQS